MKGNLPQKMNSISELHRGLGFPKPLHPLVSLVNYADIKVPNTELPKALLLNFYKISYKKHLTAKLRYGQSFYDFDEGGLSFIAPNQVIWNMSEEDDYSGYTLLLHPDFIRNYPLGTKISSYGFFSYAANEALHLFEKEKSTIFSVFQNIQEELNGTIDDFSQDVLVSHIEVLLNYSNRFYKRQFITRKNLNHDLLIRLEELLNSYFAQNSALCVELLTVEYLASQLNQSPRYLSDMLRSLTGQNAQQHIHSKIIEQAKNYLITTSLTISEIAYRLGYEHPQSFTKLFKKKTRLSPSEFKQSLN